MVFRKKKPEAIDAGVEEPEISPLNPDEVPKPPQEDSEPYDGLDPEVKETLEEIRKRYQNIYPVIPDTAIEANTLLVALLNEQRKTNAFLHELVALVMKE